MLVTVENGRAVRVAGDPAHPFTQGFLCAKVNRYVERTYHADRLTQPLRRVGAKGRGEFVPISWDDALDEIAARLTEIARSADGPQAILPYSYAGTMGLVQGSSMDRRFFHLLGASQARSHDLLDGRHRRHAHDRRREHRRRRRRDSRERSRAPVGHQHAHIESASVAVRARGAPRRARASSPSIRCARAPREQCDRVDSPFDPAPMPRSRSA